MTDERLIKEAFDSIMDCDEARAVEVFMDAEKSGVDLVTLLTDGYSAGVEHMGELFSRGEVFLPMLISSTKILKTVMAQFERIMAVAEIKCAGVDYCFFRKRGDKTYIF